MAAPCLLRCSKRSLIALRKRPLFKKAAQKFLRHWAGGGETSTAQFKNFFFKKEVLPFYLPIAVSMKRRFKRGMRLTAASPRSRARRIAGLFVENSRSSASVAASIIRLAGRRAA